MPRATFAAGAGLTRKSSLNGKQGTSFAGLRPGLGRAGVTTAFNLVGSGGGLNRKTVYYMNQVGGIGRGRSRKCGGPPCSVMRYSSSPPKTTTGLSHSDIIYLKTRLLEHFISNTFYKQDYLENIVNELIDSYDKGNTKLCMLDRLDGLVHIDHQEESDCHCDHSNECMTPSRVLKGANNVHHHRDNHQLSSETYSLTVVLPKSLVKIELCLRTLTSDIMEELDVNNDGFIDTDEADGGMMEAVFDTLDTNNDGFISEKELEDAVEHGEEIIEDEFISEAEILATTNDPVSFIAEMIVTFLSGHVTQCHGTQLAKLLNLSHILDLQTELKELDKDFIYDGMELTTKIHTTDYCGDLTKLQLPLQLTKDITVYVCTYLCVVKSKAHLTDKLNKVHVCVPNSGVNSIHKYLSTKSGEMSYVAINCDVAENDACTITSGDSLYLDYSIVSFDKKDVKCLGCTACGNKKDLQGLEIDYEGDDAYHCMDHASPVILYLENDIYTILEVNCITTSEVKSQCEFMNRVKADLLSLLSIYFENYINIILEDLVNDIIMMNKDKLHEIRDTLQNNTPCVPSFNLNTFMFTSILDTDKDCTTEHIVHETCNGAAQENEMFIENLLTNYTDNIESTPHYSTFRHSNLQGTVLYEKFNNPHRSQLLPSDTNADILNYVKNMQTTLTPKTPILHFSHNDTTKSSTYKNLTVGIIHSK